MSMKYDPGVYRIYNNINRKSYVGGTRRLSQRRKQHFSLLKLGTHPCKELQEDFNYYCVQLGMRTIEFHVLERLELVDDRLIFDCEQKWMDIIHPEYNAVLVAGKYIGDYIRTPEAKKKRAETVKGRTLSPEHKEKIRQSLLKNPPNKGRKFSDEFKKKLSVAMTGEKNPNYGLKRSPETKRKMAEKRAKTYIGAVSPDGVVYAPIHNMREFCGAHNLCESSMVALMHDRIKKHKGWIKYIAD